MADALDPSGVWRADVFDAAEIAKMQERAFLHTVEALVKKLETVQHPHFDRSQTVRMIDLMPPMEKVSKLVSKWIDEAGVPEVLRAPAAPSEEAAEEASGEVEQGEQAIAALEDAVRTVKQWSSTLGGKKRQRVCGD
tara:strand:+ start:241 stop:651 length:411 start_codon:yes stop_codon:yes gene_type:complete